MITSPRTQNIPCRDPPVFQFKLLSKRDPDDAPKTFAYARGFTAQHSNDESMKLSTHALSFLLVNESDNGIRPGSIGRNRDSDSGGSGSDGGGDKLI